MDVVQTTTHLDATELHDALGADGPELERQARAEVCERARAHSSSAALVVLFDGFDSAIFDLGASHCLRIGRSMTADIQLEHPQVSRRHAVIELLDSGTVRVLDDRSLNGVLVNEEPVAGQRALADGDEIEIAGFVLRVVVNH